MVALKLEGTAKAVLVLDEMRGRQFGAALVPNGTVVVGYESEDGRPGPEVARQLRAMADMLEANDTVLEDVTPIIPEAQA
jgi:hypothetical protein